MTLGLDWQNNNVACASRFCEHSFAVVARYNVKLPNFTFSWRTGSHPGGGGYCHIWAIWVCAAVKGMVFKQFTLG